MFVLAGFEGKGRGVLGSLLVPSSLQGVQPRPGRPRAPMAPLCSRVEILVRGDGAPVPTSPQTSLTVRESIWVEEGIKEEASGRFMLV